MTGKRLHLERKGGDQSAIFTLAWSFSLVVLKTGKKCYIAVIGSLPCIFAFVATGLQWLFRSVLISLYRPDPPTNYGEMNRDTPCHFVQTNLGETSYLISRLCI